MNETTVIVDASAYVKKTELPSNLTLYPTNVASDISSYFKMVTNVEDADYNDVAVDITTPSISGTGIEIARLATTAGVLLGNPGIINLTTLGNVRRVSGTSSATFNYEMYHRDSLGVETLIATSSMTANVDVNIYEQFSASAVLNNGDWSATDRIVIVYYGTKVGGGSNSVFEFQFGGTNPVRTIVPVPASVLLDVPIQKDVTKAVDFTSGSLLTNDGTEVTEIMPADLPVSTATQTVINGVASDLFFHASNTSNPHSVTKSQVGLSNVDNTSDANKPISTATQTALDGKEATLPTITGNSLRFLRVNSSGTSKEWANTFKWTVDATQNLIGDIYPNFAGTIASVTNVSGAPTTTIQKNGVAYTLGSAFVSGDKLTITVSIASVIDLNMTF